MAYVPPPLPPSQEEFDRRRAAGARTLAELDPALAAWSDRRARFYAFGWPVLTGVALMLALAFLVASFAFHAN